MLGALYSVARVVGGELLLLTWGICAAIYLAVGFVRRKGRGRKGRYQLLIGLLVSEVLVDVIFFLTFSQGENTATGVWAASPWWGCGPQHCWRPTRSPPFLEGERHKVRPFSVRGSASSCTVYPRC